jgi:phenylacetate-CoA ligase
MLVVQPAFDRPHESPESEYRMATSLLSIYDALPSPLKRVAMDAYATYLRSIREGDPMRSAMRDIERVDHADPITVRAYQLERINRLLSWADQHVEYYRGNVLVGSGSGQLLASLDELPRIPLLTKQQVREHGAELTAKGVKKYHGHTSGTTGTPLQLWYDRTQLAWNRAAEKVVRRRAGIEEGERVAVIWGRAVVPRTSRHAPYWIVNDVDRELWLSAFHIAGTTAAQYLSAIEQFEAVALETYPTLAYVLARFALSSGVRPRLRRVLTSAEPLLPLQREVIQEAFGAEVFDFYGAAERVTFAVECSRHDGLHILEAFGYVEPTLGSTDVTSLVVTGLTNRAMPLVRYQMTDVTRVISEPCACGLTSRRLLPIATKREDIIVTPDGRFISPSILTHPFKPLVGVLRSQIIQESAQDLLVRLETGSDYDRTQEAEMLRALRERMGPGVNIRIEEGPVLESGPAGKFRWVISRIRDPQLHS